MKKKFLITVVALICLIGTLGTTGIANGRVIVQQPTIVLLTSEAYSLAARLISDLYAYNLKVVEKIMQENPVIKRVFALIRGPDSNTYTLLSRDCCKDNEKNAICQVKGKI